MTLHERPAPAGGGAAQAAGAGLLDLLDRLRQRGVRLWADGGRLRFRAPEGALTGRLKEEIREHREELLDLLRSAGAGAGPEGGSGRTARPPLEPAALRARAGAALPASYAQERLWFFHRWAPADPLYNVLAAVELAGEVDPRALAAALAALAGRHEVLRTSFEDDGGRPHQVIHPPSPPRLPRVDLRGVPPEAGRAESRRIAREVTLRPFDLRCAPLWRSLLVRLGDDRHALVLVFHHAIFDGWSTGVLIRDLAALYEAARTDAPPPLAPLPVQYADFAAWQRSWLRGEVLDDLVAHWRERLRGVPERLELPTDRPRAAAGSTRGAAVRRPLPAPLASALDRLGREHGATLFMVLLAGFQALLARYSGQDRLAVGAPIANRSHRRVEDLVGFFVNTLVLDADLSDDPSFAELLDRARRTSLDAYAHQELPFEKLVEELNPTRDGGHASLLQAVLVLQNAPAPPFEAPGLVLRPLPIEAETAHFDLTLTVTGGDEPEAELRYARDLFERTTALRLLDHLRRLLEAAVGDPSTRVGEISFLSPGERQQLLREWNRVRLSPDAGEGGTLHALFAAWARKAPDAVALSCAERRLSYGELDRRSQDLARALRSSGVRAGDRVALLLDRSIEMVVALVAVLRAGAAYLPLEPALPDERLRFVVADAAPRLLIATPEAAERAAGLPTPVLTLGGAGDPEPTRPQDGAGRERPEAGASPDHPAYVIYTSGSTGRPKGVVVSHRNAVRLFRATEPWFGFGPDDSWSLFHSYAFDFSVWEIWGALVYGGRLVVVPWLASRSPRETHALLDRERVTVLNQTPTAFRQLVRVDGEREGRGAIGGGSLRYVVFGGEALELESLRPWLDRHGDRRPRLINMYGITETTVHVTFRPLSRDDLESAGSPIGWAIPDLGLRVLDRDARPVPLGVAGELHVAGAGLASGYLGRPGLTAERFVPDPYAEEPGGRLYRAGDLARYVAGGLEYLGRIDHQVKIRGFRIELGEVEAALASHPGVGSGVVLVREGADGEPRLVAWVVSADDGAPPAVAELRRHLASRLPEYMVPSAFASLDELPRTANGKLDRDALPEPAELAAVADGRGRTARTTTEELLAALWEEVLGAPAVGVQDNFFDLGGHSLLAAEVVARATRGFGVEVPLRLLFERPTVAGLAAAVEELRSTGADAARPPLERAPRDRPLPLSYAQERLWLFEQVTPGTSVYNTARAGHLAGPLSLGALDATFDEIVRRHEALRTRFGTDPATGEPVQAVVPHRHRPLPVADLQDLPERVRRDEAMRLANRESARPFDLAAPPLARAAVIRLAAEEHLVVLSIHHIAYDLWSGGVLLAELDALYRAFSAGAASPLPEPELQYPDWAVWQRSWLRGDVLDAELAWWRERLAGLAASPMELPADRPRASGDHRGAMLDFPLDPSLAEELRAAGRRAGATQFMVHLALFESLLVRLTGTDDPVVATAISNRAGTELEGMIGFFDNLVVLRAPAGDASRLGFAGFLDRVREVALAAYTHQHLPFELLVRELGLEREGSRAPLVQAVLLFQLNYPAMDRPIGGLVMRPWRLRAETARFDLVFSFRETPDGLLGQVEYSTGLFDRTTIRRMAGQYRTLAAAAMAAPEEPLASLPLLSAGERHQALVEWNAPPPWSGAEAVPDRLAAVARSRPDSVAVAGVGESLSFGELEARAERLAARLRRLGVGAEERVGVCLERGPALVAALYGVWKAGAAYLPLDPSYPAARLDFLLADAGARVWVSDGSAPAGVGEGLERVDPRGLADEEAAGGGSPPTSPVPPERLAYTIYTSGSTGTPKGVEIGHGALARLAVWHQEAFGVTAADRATHVAGLGFDASVWELWPHLAAGARVELPPEAVRVSPEGLRDWLLARQATVSFLPTPLAEAAVGLAWPEPVALRTLLTGGDRLRRPPRPAGGRLPFELVNDYGPTESAVVATCAVVDPDADGAPPIGRPVGRVTAHGADAALRALPIGVPGELVLGGEHLARGYRGRPALSAERFVPDPFSAAPGARLYRTGDLVRRRRDGGFDFLGRLDEQIEVRGHRIEPGEVEAALGALPEVAACAVVAPEGADGSRRLVAWVVPAAAPLDPAALARALAERLPDALVPRTILPIDALPLTAHGKIDRAALSERAPEPESSEPVAPRTELEATLAAAWADLLRRERVGVHDDFFALGGHSLLASQLVSRLREELDVDLPLEMLFDEPTPARLAARLARESEAGRGSSAGPPDRPFDPQPIDRAARGGRLDLSFAQERIWFLERLRPGEAAYTISLAIRLRGELSVPALRRAVDALVRRHEPLRTRFGVEEGRPFQSIDAPGRTPAAVPAMDLRGLPESRRRRALDAALRREVERPFDLETGPPLRLRLFRLGKDEHALLLAVHHVVADGWSMGVLVRDLETLYRDGGTGSALPDLPFQHADHAAAQRRWLGGPEAAAQVAEWRARLSGVVRRDLPPDRRAEPGASRGAGVRRRLSPPAAAAVSALARAAGASTFMMLAAALQVVLHRHTGAGDVLLGFPIAGRHRPGTEPLVGLFLNTLVLRGRVDGRSSFRELLGGVRSEALGAYARQDVPFEKLLLDLQPDRDPERTPLFQVFLNMLTLPEPPSSFGGLEVEPLALPAPPAKFDLTLYAAEGPDGLALDWVYRADRFSQARVAALADQLAAVLAQAAEAPDRALDELSLVTPEAGALFARLAAPDTGGAARAPARPITERFEEAARRRPDAEAVGDPRGRWSYGQLAQGVRGLAAALLAAGVRRGDVVAVHADRSAPLALALLGIHRAGAAFAILDASHPAPRRVRQLRAAAPRAWVELGSTPPPEPEVEAALSTLRPLARIRLPLAPDSVFEVEGRSVGAAGAPEAPEWGPEDLAYVAFTSGTGGEPKAIEGAHGPLAHFVDWHATTFGLGPDDRFAALSGLTHDPLLRDLSTPLAIGAALRVPAQEVLRDPWRLRRWLADEGVTVAHLTPAMVQLLAAGGPAGPALAFRKVFFAGELLRQRDVERLRAVAPGAEIVNFYGTTETPQAHGFHRVDPAGGEEGEIPLGRGIEGSELAVLTRSLRRAGIGEMGEICVHSGHLARGYRGRAAETARRFVPADLGGPAGSRLYRTGDLGALQPDGTVRYTGRADAQLQVRGFRIEAAEVERVLARRPGVARAVVTVVREGEESRLAAYVVPDGSGGGAAAADAEALRAAVAAELPEAMVPSVVTFLHALPLTPHGKVDRAALPAPSPSARRPGTAAPPRDRRELELVRLFEDLLGVRPVGIGDDFFRLGGHSLLAVRLVAAVRRRYGRELPLARLFADATVAGVARWLRSEAPDDPAGDGPLVALTPGDESAAARAPLFVVHPLGGSLFAYAELASRLSPGLALFGLQSPSWPEPVSLPAMAERYVEEIRRRQPAGPYRLAGWSMGGVVAFEMARRLRHAGERVALLALIDSRAPAGGEPPPEADLQRAFAADLASLAGVEPDWRDGTAAASEGLESGDFLERLRAAAEDAGALPRDLDPAELRRLYETFRSNALALASHRPEAGAEGAPEVAVLFRAAGRPEEHGPGWRERLPGLRIVDLPGDHYGILRGAGARALADALGRLAAGGQSRSTVAGSTRVARRAGR